MVTSLAATAPPFLLLFAATYFLMAQADLGNFNLHPLTRTDSLYFTVTVFATVGFGDITATSQTGRLLVTAQMILDLIVLGLGIRVFLGAVQRGRQQDAAQQETKSR
jgi:Ion channel